MKRHDTVEKRQTTPPPQPPATYRLQSRLFTKSTSFYFADSVVGLKLNVGSLCLGRNIWKLHTKPQIFSKYDLDILKIFSNMIWISWSHLSKTSAVVLERIKYFCLFPSWWLVAFCGAITPLASPSTTVHQIFTALFKQLVQLTCIFFF